VDEVEADPGFVSAASPGNEVGLEGGVKELWVITMEGGMDSIAAAPELDAPDVLL